MVADEVVYGWAVHYFEDEWQVAAKRKAEAIAYAKNVRSLAERLHLGTTAIEGV